MHLFLRLLRTYPSSLLASPFRQYKTTLHTTQELIPTNYSPLHFHDAAVHHVLFKAEPTKKRLPFDGENHVNFCFIFSLIFSISHVLSNLWLRVQQIDARKFKLVEISLLLHRRQSQQ